MAASRLHPEASDFKPGRHHHFFRPAYILVVYSTPGSPHPHHESHHASQSSYPQSHATGQEETYQQPAPYYTVNNYEHHQHDPYQEYYTTDPGPYYPQISFAEIYDQLQYQTDPYAPYYAFNPSIYGSGMPSITTSSRQNEFHNQQSEPFAQPQDYQAPHDAPHDTPQKDTVPSIPPSSTNTVHSTHHQQSAGQQASLHDPSDEPSTPVSHTPQNSTHTTSETNPRSRRQQARWRSMNDARPRRGRSAQRGSLYGREERERRETLLQSEQHRAEAEWRTRQEGELKKGKDM